RRTMNLTSALCQRLAQAVNRQRLLDTAVRLIAVPSRTGEAGAAADCLAQVLAADGFPVERPDAGHPAPPAVAVRLDSNRPRRSPTSSPTAASATPCCCPSTSTTAWRSSAAAA